MAALTKVSILETDIDIARSRGLWLLCNSLADKYRTKYFNQALEYLVQAHVLIMNTLSECLDDFSFDVKLDYSESFLPLVAETVEIQQAQALLQKVSSSADAGQTLVQEAQVLNQLSLLLTGKLADLKLNTLTFESNTFNGPVFQLISLIIRLVYHLKHNHTETVNALMSEHFKSVESVSRTEFPLMKTSKANAFIGQGCDQWFVWKEFFLYIYVYTQTTHSLSACTQYLDTAKLLPTSKGLDRRKCLVYSVYLDNLSKPLQSPAFDPFHPFKFMAIPFEESINDFQVNLEEYNRLLLNECAFPRGTLKTSQEKARQQLLLSLYDHWTCVKAHRTPNETLETLLKRHYDLILLIYNGIDRSYLSLKLARQLLFVFCSLISGFKDKIPSSDHIEAIKVADRYVSLFQRRAVTLIEDEMKEKSVDEIQVALNSVDGESVEECVLAILAGVSINLKLAKGNLLNLRKALKWNRFIKAYFEQHGTVIENERLRSKLKTEIDCFLTICLKQLAANVPESEARKETQKEALYIFSDLEETPYTLYQNAVLLGEIGEIDEAIALIKRSLAQEPSNPLSWTLLLLCLTCHKQLDNALTVFNAAWKECVSFLVAKYNLKSFSSTTESLSEVAYGSWKDVEFDIRLALFNLKLTQFTIEVSRFGFKAVQTSLSDLFSLFKRLFGSFNETREEFHASSFETLIGLWLLAASCYRSIDDHDSANGSLKEAYKTLETFGNTLKEHRYAASPLNNQIDHSIVDEKLNQYLSRIEAFIKFEDCCIKLSKLPEIEHLQKYHGLKTQKIVQEPVKSAFGLRSIKFRMQSGASFHSTLSGGNSNTLNPAADYDQVIGELHSILVLDDLFLPARILLAQLYYTSQEYVQAEFWLERTIKRSNFLGHSEGSNECAAVMSYGTTSSWGWHAWYLLAQVSRHQGDHTKAADCIMFGLNLMQCTGIRGFECLERF